jgi:hypothetical protein
MTLVIRPNEGVGDITFGMSQADVHRILGPAPLQKSSDSDVPSDYYPTYSMLIHYANDATVEAIEVGANANAILMGQMLSGSPFDEISSWLRAIDPRLQLDPDGLTSFRFGIGLYAPHARKEPHQPVEGVIAFRPGYYG